MLEIEKKYISLQSKTYMPVCYNNINPLLTT